ncbi:MAG: histidinol-phosphate transaminase [Candidatus Omnitrophica bacterium]|nr:histidinol-phosphate transaminase [Candidatus Omnitrophota bacterium]
MRKLARKKIRNIKPYKPGKPIKELERELGISERDIIKLASNENPIGPSPRAIKAIRESIDLIHRYPDGSSFYLKKKLASKLRLKPQNIILGNGSDEIIDIVTKAFLEEDEEAIISEPSFLEYRIIVKTRGARIKASPMELPSVLGGKGSSRRFAYNIDDVLRSITRKTKLIFIGNPDNPTGSYLTKKELAYFLKKCPKKVIVVFDEAYREFVDKRDYSNPIDFIDKHSVIILRTFSKAYGLAGLRIGYAVTSEKLAGWMERVRQPFNVNLLAQIAAESALDDKAHLSKTKAVIKKGREYLEKDLKRLGFDIIKTPANFLLISYRGVKGTDLFKSLLPYGVIIRDMKVYGLPAWVRVNVGTMDENRRLIKTLKRLNYGVSR